MRFLKGKLYADNTAPNFPVMKGGRGNDCDDVNKEDWAALGCTELQLGCTGLYQAVPGCTWLYWALFDVLDCTGLYWAVLDCIGLHMHWAVLVCKLAAQGCTGLYWTLLSCTGL